VAAPGATEPSGTPAISHVVAAGHMSNVTLVPCRMAKNPTASRPMIVRSDEPAGSTTVPEGTHGRPIRRDRGERAQDPDVEDLIVDQSTMGVSP
jgi:hypothetical protein